MMITRLTLCATALVVLSVTGCARTDDGAPAGSAPAGSTAPAPSASEPAGSPSAAGPQTLTGTIVAGVEPNCLLLEGAGDPYLLIFKDDALRSAAKVGSRVTVSGTAEPGTMTTCQQGTPFMVTSISAG